MVLKSYLDGGNKPDSTQYETMTLASISGSENLWLAFEKDWKKNLRANNAPYLHTTDLMTRNGVYKGWTEKQRDKFLEGCVTVSIRHGGKGAIDGDSGRYGLYTFVIGFNLKDFVDYRALDAESPQNADEGCLRQALHECIEWGRNQAACDEFRLFFDQGESFYGYAQHILDSKQARKTSPILESVFIAKANWRKTPALQLADLHAWDISRPNTPLDGMPRWQRRLRKQHRSVQFIDKTVIHLGDKSAQTIWKTFNMPKRSIHP